MLPQDDDRYLFWRNEAIKRAEKVEISGCLGDGSRAGRTSGDCHVPWSASGIPSGVAIDRCWTSAELPLVFKQKLMRHAQVSTIMRYGNA